MDKNKQSNTSWIFFFRQRMWFPYFTCLALKDCCLYLNQAADYQGPSKLNDWSQTSLCLGLLNGWINTLFSCSAIILNYFMYGLYLGSPTVIIPQLIREANSTDAVTPEMASWLSSVSVWTTLPWVFILPILSYRFGRKICLILISINVLIGNIIFYFSTTFKQIIISLAVQGMLVGSMTTVTIMVSSEYTSPKYRGIFLTFKSATLYWGVWVSNAIGTFFYWRNIGIVIFVCGIYNLTTIFCKESPYWLATKGRFDECANVHRWLKGTDDDSEQELRKLISSQQEHLNKKNSIHGQTKAKKLVKMFNILRRKSFYIAFMYASLPSYLCTFSGKMACTVYAIDILKKITSSERMAYEGMLILDAVTVVGMYSGSALSKILARRKQMLVFSSIGIGFLYILSIYLYMIKFNVIPEHHYVSLFFLLGFSLSISCGTIIIAPCCSAELAPLSNRSLFICCLAFFSNILLAITLKTSPFIFKLCGTHGAFLFFAVSSSVFLILIYKYLPETKGKSIQEIEELITKGCAYDRKRDKTETIALKEHASK